MQFSKSGELIGEQAQDLRVAEIVDTIAGQASGDNQANSRLPQNPFNQPRLPIAPIPQLPMPNRTPLPAVTPGILGGFVQGLRNMFTLPAAQAAEIDNDITPDVETASDITRIRVVAGNELIARDGPTSVVYRANAFMRDGSRASESTESSDSLLVNALSEQENTRSLQENRGENPENAGVLTGEGVASQRQPERASIPSEDAVATSGSGASRGISNGNGIGGSSSVVELEVPKLTDNLKRFPNRLAGQESDTNLSARGPPTGNLNIQTTVTRPTLLQRLIHLPEGANLAFSHNLPISGRGNLLGRLVTFIFNHAAHKRENNKELNIWGKFVKAVAGVVSGKAEVLDSSNRVVGLLVIDDYNSYGHIEDEQMDAEFCL